VYGTTARLDASLAGWADRPDCCSHRDLGYEGA